jgi:hypothetical protein
MIPEVYHLEDLYFPKSWLAVAVKKLALGMLDKGHCMQASGKGS